MNSLELYALSFNPHKHSPSRSVHLLDKTLHRHNNNEPMHLASVLNKFSFSIQNKRANNQKNQTIPTADQIRKNLVEYFIEPYRIKVIQIVIFFWNICSFPG